jgi:hypothetical protein
LTSAPQPATPAIIGAMIGDGRATLPSFRSEVCNFEQTLWAAPQRMSTDAIYHESNTLALGPPRFAAPIAGGPERVLLLASTVDREFTST